MSLQPRQSEAPSNLRTCHYCKLPIPDDERGVAAATDNAWAHFECWYDGSRFKRDPVTGEKISA